MTHTSSKTIAARDGHPLAVRWFEPAHQAARGTVLIGSATAVRQTYYEKFAHFLAKHQYRVVTFDYRGIAGSRAADWGGAAPTMTDWGRNDLASLIDWADQQWPQDPILYLGHSVGGQLLGLTDNHHKVKGALMIAAQNGYWRYWAGTKRLRRWLDWHLVLPAATRLYGRLPGFLLGGEDLPASVSLEWSRWCRHPEFIHDESGQPLKSQFADVRTPLQFWGFSDDHDFAPEAAVRALSRFYSNSPSRVRIIRPQEFGLQALGHFGFFKSSAAGPLWDEAAAWCERFAPSVQPQAGLNTHWIIGAEAGALG